MISTLAKLAQKPSDKNIRIVRVVFALILIVVIYFGYSVTTVNFGLPTEIKYALYFFPIISLIRGIFDPGIVRKGIWKWIMVGLGSTMMLISLILIDDIENSEVAPIKTQIVSGESKINIADITNTAESNDAFHLSTDNWFGFFGFVLIIIGLTMNGKNITTKNERYGEVIKKIRV